MRTFGVVLALAGVLVACGSPRGEERGPASSAPGVSEGPSTACHESFAELAALPDSRRVITLPPLGDLPDELRPTLESCASVAEWIAGAQQLMAEEIKPRTAELLLSISCEDQSLAAVPICEELGGS
jgi:hypothetical protein